MTETGSETERSDQRASLQQMSDELDLPLCGVQEIIDDFGIEQDDDGCCSFKDYERIKIAVKYSFLNVSEAFLCFAANRGKEGLQDEQ